MSMEKDLLKNICKEMPRKVDLSLQSSNTKPLDLERIIGKTSEEKNIDITKTTTPKQEGN